MSITFTANYKETVTPETLAKIEELVEENYELRDILEFIDEHTEEEFVAFYEEYVTQGENLGYEVVDAYLQEFDYDDLAQCEEKFVGRYGSEAEFAEEYTDELGYSIPDFIVVDWQETWDRNLYYDFTFVRDINGEGFMFRQYL